MTRLSNCIEIAPHLEIEAPLYMCCAVLKVPVTIPSRFRRAFAVTVAVFFQDNALSLTMRVLLAIKPSQIEDAVSSLGSIELIDVLMKYVYKGFEVPSEGSSGHLLIWHEKAFNVGGVGSIVRVLSDTKRA